MRAVGKSSEEREQVHVTLEGLHVDKTHENQAKTTNNTFRGVAKRKRIEKASENSVYKNRANK